MKNKIVMKLPISYENYTLREIKRSDFDLYAKWPKYPEPYESYNTVFEETSDEERDERFEKYSNQNESIMFSIDYMGKEMIGKFSFLAYDEENKSINNMSIRLHPDWCDAGHGTKLLSYISELAASADIESISFDVNSNNKRALKSYTKAGFSIAGEHELKEQLYYWMKKDIKKDE